MTIALPYGRNKPRRVRKDGSHVGGGRSYESKIADQRLCIERFTGGEGMTISIAQPPSKNRERNTLHNQLVLRPFIISRWTRLVDLSVEKGLNPNRWLHGAAVVTVIQEELRCRIGMELPIAADNPLLWEPWHHQTDKVEGNPNVILFFENEEQAVEARLVYNL